ncbi:MAG: Arm DNA-binding domain-containing protein, partial [Wenzhouxiangella sp.]|nr:Arm DNA-binding domain-containing protein [Wenzhouxiangella sp.]
MLLSLSRVILSAGKFSVHWIQGGAVAVVKLVEKDGARIEVRETKHGRPNPDYRLPAVGWRIRVYIGTDPETGKRTYVTRTFERKKDADAEATRLERSKDLGALTQPSK